mmetsp:Transcript_13819/g.27966  ORF Transcript_13819/g.27966 Transcript_13819/m.27966 type:complete len:86 (+) Transcript_13819:297-554(+)
MPAEAKTTGLAEEETVAANAITGPLKPATEIKRVLAVGNRREKPGKGSLIYRMCHSNNYNFTPMTEAGLTVDRGKGRPDVILITF